MEGAEDVQGLGGAEPEDGFSLVQHDEGLWTEGDSCHLTALRSWLRGGEGIKEVGPPFPVDPCAWATSGEGPGGVRGNIRLAEIYFSFRITISTRGFQPGVAAHGYSGSPREA